MDTNRFGFSILTAFVFLFAIVLVGINASYSIDENEGYKWDVGFSSIGVTDTTTSIYDIPVIPNEATSLNNIKFAFNSSGDKIVYKITVLNKGNVDAKIAAKTITDASCSDIELCKNLDYSLTYDNGEEVKKGDVLKSYQGSTLYLTFQYNGTLDKEVVFDNIALSLNYIEG